MKNPVIVNIIMCFTIMIVIYMHECRSILHPTHGKEFNQDKCNDVDDRIKLLEFASNDTWRGKQLGRKIIIFTKFSFRLCSAFSAVFSSILLYSAQFSWIQRNSAFIRTIQRILISKYFNLLIFMFPIMLFSPCDTQKVVRCIQIYNVITNFLFVIFRFSLLSYFFLCHSSVKKLISILAPCQCYKYFKYRNFHVLFNTFAEIKWIKIYRCGSW